MRFFSETRPPFPGGSRTENDIRKWKLEKSTASGLQDFQTGFAMRQRLFSDPEAVSEIDTRRV